MKTKLSSSAVWEDIVGYSRAIKVGNVIEIAGTASVKNGEVIHTHDPYLQAGYILNIIENALKQLDDRLDDVIRTRIYLRNVDDWQQVAKAHKEYFGKIKPVCTMVAVSSMINPDILVEIEATAVLT